MGKGWIRAVGRAALSEATNPRIDGFGRVPVTTLEPSWVSLKASVEALSCKVFDCAQERDVGQAAKQKTNPAVQVQLQEGALPVIVWTLPHKK